MYIDSHCHLDFPDLRERLDDILERMRANDVARALCVAVNLDDYPAVLAIAEQHPQLNASVGVHPDYENVEAPTVAGLTALATHSKVVAIGETGLDYYRLQGDLEWQRERFRVHIRAARQAGLPLIIHTRAASQDTLTIMREEGADQAGGVMHCFTEDWPTARAALDMGFHISFSGIVTFKSAASLREVAAQVPPERLLIETDSPYLAPVPFRGKTNEPAFVKHVAECLAQVRGTTPPQIGEQTTNNYFQLFKKIDASLNV